MCWSPQALYVATCVIDIVEPDYYKNGDIPDIDRALWSIRLNGLAPITTRIGAGKSPANDPPTFRIASLSGTYHDVRCITAIEIPAKHLGKERSAAGDRVSLESTFDTLGRAQRMEWRGDFELAQ
jgi:hypothetical protein